MTFQIKFFVTRDGVLWTDVSIPKTKIRPLYRWHVP